MTTNDEKPTCTKCYGNGTVTESRTEPDPGMSIVMGAATDTGYFPMTRTVTESVTCPRCHGSRKEP